MNAKDVKELNKKLAEWRRWKVYQILGEDLFIRWMTPEGKVDGSTPPDFTESLDVCFEHLVPEALKIFAEKGYCPPIIKLFQLWYDELVSLTGNSSNVQQAALALCLAIEKLKENK